MSLRSNASPPVFKAHMVIGFLFLVLGLVSCFGFLLANGFMGNRQLKTRVLAYTKGIAGVVSSANFQSAKDISDVLENLTVCKGFHPFFVPSDGSSKEPLPAKVQMSMAKGSEGVEVLGDTAFGWTRISGGNTIGVKMKAPTANLLEPVLVLLGWLGVVLLVVGGTGLQFGKKVFPWLQDRARILGGIPEETIAPSVPCPFGNLAAIDQEIALIDITHADNRTSQQTRIDAGRESRGKKAHVFASMSHDLKSPLNSIIGFSDLLIKGMDGELLPGQQKMVQSIGQESERLIVMIGDILDTAKLDAGQFELDRQWVPSVEILTDCESGARKLTGASSIDFICEFEPGLPPVKVDKERITRAILGLIARAVDSMEEGLVRLKASKMRSSEGEGFLKVEVIDTGRRISDEKRDRLFNLFLATEGMLETGEVGAARMGLSLSRRIVRLLGGDVHAESIRDTYGKGSIFTVTLPLDDDRNSN